MWCRQITEAEFSILFHSWWEWNWDNFYSMQLDQNHKKYLTLGCCNYMFVIHPQNAETYPWTDLCTRMLVMDV